MYDEMNGLQVLWYLLTNWEEGKDAMNANREGVQSYLSSH